tara:strand:+ start:170 stop:547 length:378 start_codon:yes stop_codon:yes gene_type:complete
MNKEEILNIANEVYPKIVKHFGKGKQSIPTIEVYRNVYVALTGDEDAEGEQEPTGRYDRESNEIQLFLDYIPNKEEVIRNVIHEYTHYKQPDGLDTKYYDQGYTYQNNPAELEALKAEEKWHLFV